MKVEGYKCDSCGLLNITEDVPNNWIYIRPYTSNDTIALSVYGRKIEVVMKKDQHYCTRDCLVYAFSKALQAAISEEGQNDETYPI